MKTPSGLRPSILADIAGPKIRIKGLNENKDYKRDPVLLSNDKNNQSSISISEGVHFEKVNLEQRYLSMTEDFLEVKELVSNQTIDCIAINDGFIENGKGVNFPGIALNVPTLTKQDKRDLSLSLSEEADWLALSLSVHHLTMGMLKTKSKALDSIPL